MAEEFSRRTFLEGTALGAASLGAIGSLAARAAAEPATTAPEKIRIAKVYFGIANPAWPKAVVDVAAEQNRFERELTRMQPAMPDIEWIDCGLVATDADFARVKEKLARADGILFLQLTMGASGTLHRLMKIDLPIVWFAEPYCGHEWTMAPSFQQRGKRIDCYASSRLDDIVQAIRPIRAIGRLKNAKILHVSTREADPKFAAAIREKFGTTIKSLGRDDLKAAYDAMDAQAVEADADQWARGAEKVVEPNREDLLKASRMALAIEEMVRRERAAAITINCLGMNLLSHGMGYPCLGFCRLNSCGSGGICEADLHSTMTHLIFNYLVGRPGFVTDPCFDYSTNTILHAHCVAATKMLGPDSPAHPYIIRSHLEDDKSAVLQVKLPVNQTVSMAKLVDGDRLLFSTGEAIDSPLVDRGCRTKLAVRVAHPERFLEGWSSGLHRVVFYGDHTRDVERFCRLTKIRLVREDTSDAGNATDLNRPAHIYAS